MFGIGMPELILILAVALIVIGPKKLPDLAKSLGKAMGEFKKATSDLKESMQIDTELKEVKTAFNDIGKDFKTESRKTSKQTHQDTADVDMVDATTAPDQAPNSDDDAKDTVTAAFDHQDTKASDSGDAAEKDAPSSDAEQKAETRKE